MVRKKDWIVRENGRPNARAVERLGDKMLIGNGYLGYRGTLEEYSHQQKSATILAGLYDQVGKHWREPVNLPNGGLVQVIYRGQVLHALSSKIKQHCQSLDMYQAIHQRETWFEIGDGRQIAVRARRFLSLARYPLLCLEYTLQANEDLAVTVRAGIDGEVWDLNGPHLRDQVALEQDGLLSLTARTQERHIPVAISEWVDWHEGEVSYLGSAQGVYRLLEIPLRAHQPLTLHKFVAHCTAQSSPNPLEESRQLCRQAASLGFEHLLDEHRRLWAARWERCDVQIQGDALAQQALRFSLYHLLSVAPAHAENLSIPARGLSGQTYKGAVFWDTEMFMLPFFTATLPSTARNLLRYRFHTLDGARRKARQYGYRGAFYAWESQENGDDACTLFNVTDVLTQRPIRTYFRDKQIHISADIVYALWQYVQVSGDESILLDGGAEIIFECARFFLSAIYYHPDRERYEILDVTGPDEYHERVHNNFYTNRMVRHTFDVCQRVADWLKENYPQSFQEIMDKLDFAEDLARIRTMTPAIYLPRPDPKNGLIPQFDGYFDLEDLSLPELLKRKLHPHEYLGGGNGLATTTQIIKQADVVLTLALFPQEYPSNILEANWDYYESRTEHGSSLSACAYALLAARLGRTQPAYDYFLQSATIDLKGKGKQYVGPLYIGGTHPAANGGAWISAVHGLCGIHWTGKALEIAPHLPLHWKEVRLPLVIRGWRLQTTLTPSMVTIEVRESAHFPLMVQLDDSTYPLPEQGTLTLPLSKEAGR